MTTHKPTVISIIVDQMPAAGLEDTATRWIIGRLSKTSRVRAELLSLRDFPLPPCRSQPVPALAAREAEVVTRWREAIARSDGFVFHVSPQHGGHPPAALTNAMDWAYPAWKDKAAAFVKHGGQLAWRFVQQLRVKAAALRMIAARSEFPVPALSGPAGCAQAHDALQDLLWWTEMLKAMREECHRAATRNQESREQVP